MTTAKRTTFYFPEEAAGFLQRIRSRSRLDNAANVVRAALGAYDDLLQVTLAGGTIFIRDGKNTEWAYSPFTPFTYPGFDEGTEQAGSAEPTEKAPKNLVFSGAAAEALLSIRKRSYLESSARVIRAALAAYDELTRVFSVGDQIFIRTPEGDEVAYNPYVPLDRTGLRFLETGNDGTAQGSSARSENEPRRQREPELVS